MTVVVFAAVVAVNVVSALFSLVILSETRRCMVFRWGYCICTPFSYLFFALFEVEHALSDMKWKKILCVNNQPWFYSVNLVLHFQISNKDSVVGRFWKEQTGKFLLFLVSTERMHLKVRELYGKQLIFREVESGPVLHFCYSTPLCSTPSCSLSCVRKYVWLLL